MLLKHMYVSFPGEGSSLCSTPRCISKREELLLVTVWGWGFCLLFGPSLDCCFLNLDVQGDHLQIDSEPLRCVGWEFAFLLLQMRCLPQPRNDTLKPVKCVRRTSEHACVWLFPTVPVTTDWRLGLLPRPDEPALPHPCAGTLLPFLCRWSYQYFAVRVLGGGEGGGRGDRGMGCRCPPLRRPWGNWPAPPPHS